MTELHTFVGLYQGDRRVAAQTKQGKFGLSWLTRSDEQARGLPKWITFGRTSRQQREHGLRERPELAPSHLHVVSGMSGKFPVRDGCPWGTDARLKFGPDPAPGVETFLQPEVRLRLPYVD